MASLSLLVCVSTSSFLCRRRCARPITGPVQQQEGDGHCTEGVCRTGQEERLQAVGDSAGGDFDWRRVDAGERVGDGGAEDQPLGHCEEVQVGD